MAPATTFPLIGRQSHLNKAIDHLEKASEGHGSIALISGHPGIGKTRFLHEIVQLGKHYKFTTLVGKCPSDDPELLVAVKEIENQMEGMIDNETAIGTGSITWEKMRSKLIQDILHLARSVPVIVAVEDLHWADSNTLNFFHSLGRRVEDSSILLIGTYRDDEVERQASSDGECGLLDIKNVLQRQTNLVNIDLDKLTEDDANELIENYLGAKCDIELKKAIIDRSLGNPLFILENIKSMRRPELSIKKWIDGITMTRNITL